MRHKQAKIIAIAFWMTCIALFSSMALAQTATPGAGSTAAAVNLIPLEVLINDTPSGQWILLERNNQLYAPEDAFVEWRIDHRPDAATFEYRGQKWVPLNSVPGFESRYNYANQSVELIFSPQAFATTRLAKEAAARPELTPTTPAAFLNYDLNYAGTSYRQAPRNRELSALTELGVAAGSGVLTSSYVGHNLTSTLTTSSPNWRRLETAYSQDFPDNNISLKLGDSVTRTGAWGRPVFFGGIQLGKNFALTPGFITQPIPVVRGTSSAPSTVELYVNDVLRQTSQVPTGPFTIDNFPLLTSTGDARMVVRDALGRETVIEQSFFTHPSMLEQGLSDWSLEAGATRNNLGTDNANYGQHFASGLVRHGLSKAMTLEGRAEYGQTTHDAGLGANLELPFQTLGQVAISASNDKLAGSGKSWLIGIDRNSLLHHTSLRLENASINYRLIGLQTLPYRRQLSGNYSYSLEQSGSLGIGLARIETYDRGTMTTYSGNYARRTSKNGSLVFSGAKVISVTPSYFLGVTLLMPLDNQVNFTSNVSRKSGRNEAYASLSKNLPQSTGTGWRALAGNHGGQNYGEGGLYYQGDHGLLTSDASVSAGQQSYRLGAQGGMVMMDGHVFMTRRVDQSFALVEVPGYANVGVGFQSSVLTHTDKNGVALVPRLLPYQRNSILLDPTELPIDAELDTIEQTAVPRARSGVKITFPVRSGRGGLIHIVQEDGSDAPAGAVVTLEGDKEEFYVARRGEAFVTGLQDTNMLHMHRDDGSICSFTITLPKANPNEIPRIGPILCHK